MWELRDYQQRAVDDALTFLRGAKRGDRRLYVAPCGTGKSVVEIAVQQAIPGSVIITPRDEIRDGMVSKGGCYTDIYTPLTLRNRLLDGSVSIPSALIVDEAHHDTSETGVTLRLCCGEVPTVAYTATPYRGTPKGTRELRELYGEPHHILTLRDAVARGICTLPQCHTTAILDDDIIEVMNGEFKVRVVEAKTPWNAAADLVQSLWSGTPTVVCLPGVSAVKILAEALEERGVPTRCVTGETTTSSRKWAFENCVAGDSVLLQVQVLGEGVDLPIRLLIDLAPTMSPVRWLQQVGRAMRPGGTSRYVCCNRNLLRHGYLLEGLVPSEAFAQAESAFPAPPKRAGIRAFGLEGLGRLRPCSVPLANGTRAWAYYVSKTEGTVERQYVAIVLPQEPDPLWATRLNAGGWGKWEACDSPADLCGFASGRPYPLTLKQSAWWKRDAKRHGLDPDAKVDAKIFQTLPVLANLRKVIQ